MAGEIIGKIYEAILQVVLWRLKAKCLFVGDVFWNLIPEGITVEPDFLLGSDKDHPSHFFFVTHCGSSKNSDMKTWRNIGELCEAKSVLSPTPLAINVAFETVWKADLKKLQEGAFDSQLLVDERPYGSDLVAWVHANVGSIPGTQEEKAEKIKELTATDSKLESLLKKLEADVESCLKNENRDLVALWSLEKARQKGVAPKAKKTYVRRGWTKRLLLGRAYVEHRVVVDKGGDFVPLGLVKKTIGKYVVCDEELRWFLSTNIARRYDTLAVPFMTDGFCSQLQKVRSYKLIDCYFDYVVKNYDRLIVHENMYGLIQALHKNPAGGIAVPDGCEKPQNVWVYDVIAAISKAVDDRAQAFGYSSFASHKDAKKSKIGNMPLGIWCNHFAGEYFNRKSLKVTEAAISFMARVLSDQLAKFTINDVKNARKRVLSQYLEKEYEAVLLAHRGFEPLLALAHSVLPKLSKVSYRTCFAEKAGLGGAAGKTTVAQYKDVIVNWQSAYGGHSNDKRKELCGRAVGLRYTWDAAAKEFKPRPGVKKLVLLLDGTWTQKDLNALVAAGWDEIYYPDEIDKLKASVLGTGKKGGVLPKLSHEDDDEMLEAAEEKGYGKKG